MFLKRLFRYVAIAVLLALLGGCIYLNGLMPIITGYAAKNLASAVFVSGRSMGGSLSRRERRPAAGRGGTLFSAVLVVSWQMLA